MLTGAGTFDPIAQRFGEGRPFVADRASAAIVRLTTMLDLLANPVTTGTLADLA